MSRILAVDDEEAIRRLLEVILRRGGHDCVAVGDARAALAAAADPRIDAVIVDLGLPDRDGLELVSALRAAGPLPILVVSARSSAGDKVAALDLGADDYVTKPFDGDELLARLRSLLRRSGRNADGLLSFGALSIDRPHRRVTLAGRETVLTPKEFALLELLTEAAGKVLTHAQLLERVWGPAHRGDVAYLRVTVRALRLKLEADPAHPRLLLNEPGIGYRLAELDAPVAGAPATGAPATGAPVTGD